MYFRTLFTRPGTLKTSFSTFRPANGPRAPFTSFQPRRAATLKQGPQPSVPKSSAASSPKARLANVPAAAPALKALTPTKLNQHYKALKLFENGHSQLFKAPANMGYLAGSYILGGLCFCGTIWMLFTEHWREQEEIKLPWFVPVAYRISMFFMSMLGGWVILRSGRLISRIDLVPKNSEVTMLVTLKRPLPFIRAKKIYTPPSDLILPTKLVAPVPVPAWAQPRVEPPKSILSKAAKGFSVSTFNFFAGTRKIFTQEGLMQVSIVNHGGGYKLDIAGEFDNHGVSLTEVATIDS